MNITFLNHASFIISTERIKLLCDPWLFGSIFNNGWRLFKEENHDKQLKGITHIFFSHEHPDHFSVQFIKKIDEKLRSNITILYQETFDKKIKKFCEKLGYKFIELKNKTTFKLDNNFEVICGTAPVYDSWINFRINNYNFLNVNDCVLANSKLIYEIRQTIKGNINTLTTQFSYACYGEDKISREKSVTNQLKSIKKQDQILKPTFIIPAFSFVYFSNIDNKYMNDSVNTIMKMDEFVKVNCQADIIIMKPNQTWDGFTQIDNSDSLNYWNKIYDNLGSLNIDKENKRYSSEILIEKSNVYIKNIMSRNNKYLIYILRYLGFFKDLFFYVIDQKKTFKFSIIDGLKEIKNIKTKDMLCLNSDSLAFVFDYDYGMDTLNVNGRFKPNPYYLKVKKTFIIGPLNNTGRYLKFKDCYKYLDKNFFFRCLKIAGFKKTN